MGKHEVGTPKYIANKMKAKGLQKLRWYCQMCTKQCRDENGFKCHITSESHQRQLLLFADNQRKYLGQFSREFCEGFLHLLRRQFGTKRVHANRVYQEYIADRHHLHMNSTRWETLTGFVKWLGREGKCVVDETEKGWFITYIDRDAEAVRLQDSMSKKEKMDKDDNERMMDFLNKQIERDRRTMKIIEPYHSTELIRKDDEKITINIPTFKKPEPLKLEMKSALLGLKAPKKESGSTSKKETNKRKSALDEIMEEEEKNRLKVKKRDYWLDTDIVVKVMTSSLGEKYKNKKGVVVEILDKFTGLIRLIDTGTKLKLDQCHLETVIPAVGRKVKVLNGAYRGTIAELLDIDSDHFCINVKILCGPLNGKIVKGLPYEDVSKLYIPS